MPSHAVDAGAPLGRGSSARLVYETQQLARHREARRQAEDESRSQARAEAEMDGELAMVCAPPSHHTAHSVPPHPPR